MEEEAGPATWSKPPRLGVFIRDFLRWEGESYAEEIHRAYKLAHRGWPTTKGGKYHLSTYNSFACYVSKLGLCGLVEKCGRVEESDNPRARALDYPERVYLRLTRKGERAPDYVWFAPLRIWYYPFSWEREEHREYVKGGT